ncbi:GvpL/GvpF family gas vesicle protein [Streptomyces sp. RKAG290]|uniref:GvpL/GvpF family gas vesicle protein n=1 Tax=Streptomyces sp. RKAG290 TaxID=2888348 RepID=UPI002033F99B|nr:GvpL/GvpF family gas vesicle protein [Streptomyces sp. RKAG290]MCM2410643.1 GvpL/GvpF family gas vesicle protein [Streptomyces sp. RKAG290]
MTADGVYVYAILRAGTALPKDAAGVGSPPATLRTIRQGRLDAVISDAPPQLRARRRDLLAHQDLLMRLSDEGPVLPMRFGMVAPDEETILQQLAAAESAHGATLDQLAGRIEINVKALPAQNALAALVAEEKNVRQLREAARRHPGYEASVRLGEAIAAALTRRAAAAGRRILRELEPRAHAVAAGPEVPGCALNISFLVDHSATGTFLTTARNFAQAHGDHVELRLAGPLPCYSFVSSAALPVPVSVGGE